MLFVLLFIVLPFLEISTFIMVGREIGVFNTFFLSFLMAIIGGLIVRHQGFGKLLEVHKAFSRGEMPSKEIFDGLMIALAAGLMITPGFVTDFIGFLLLVPAVRNFIRQRLIETGEWRVSGFSADFTEFNGARARRPSNDPDVIDVPFKSLSEKDKP